MYFLAIKAYKARSMSMTAYSSAQGFVLRRLITIKATDALILYFGADAPSYIDCRILLSEVEKKTGAEFVAYGTMGLNLGRGKKIT